MNAGGSIKKAYLNFISDRKNIIFGGSIFFVPILYELFGSMDIEKNITPYTFPATITNCLQSFLGTEGVIAHMVSYYYFFIYLFVISGLAFAIFFAQKPWIYSFAVLISLCIESAIYLIFPLAPPVRTRAAVPIRLNLFHTSDHFVAIKYSAFPSGHIMISFLGFLICRKENFKKTEMFYLLNTLLMSVIVLYLGEHYLIDVFGGILLALFAFKIVDYIAKKYTTQSQSLSP